MLRFSSLYPVNNSKRTVTMLDGMWKFQFDPKSIGEKENWQNGLPTPISMPVPSSFSDLFTTEKERDYCGDFWYETSFYRFEEAEEKDCIIRFGSITHRAKVFCNGILVAEHEGGFLPVVADVSDAARYGVSNTLVVLVNNEVNETSLPCGAVKVKEDGTKLAKPYFDFFNYSGIQRSVKLLTVPKTHIVDYEVSYDIKGDDALVHYQVVSNNPAKAEVVLTDAEGNVVGESSGNTGAVEIKNVHLWKVLDAYLYNVTIRLFDDEKLLDEYSDRIGIRTVEISDARIKINGEAVYLKGYGKHEDFDVLGRSFNYSVMKRDFELMKWSGANCFRTSHYPYDEEWYRFADEEGFLIIDEVPAVGMMRSTRNFVAAGSGQYTYFFEAPTVPQLKAAHMRDVEEMFQRDKNHPSVIAWSLFNEPETTSADAKAYFTDIFNFARTLDPQNRPLTGAFEKNSAPDLCQCYQLCDFICLNRYYGWYISGGELDEAMDKFRMEMDKWKEKNLNIPFVFTEFGTDTLALEHKLPAVMWSQEYQDNYLERNFEIFDSYDFIQGELVWNFADFQTSEGIFRVNGNKKGIFTRNRQPKQAAFILKKRWDNI